MVAELCPSCPQRIPCGQEGMALITDLTTDRVTGDELPEPTPSMLLPFGGMLPERLLEVWRSASAAPMICRSCRIEIEAADWNPEKRLCTPCKEG